MQSLLLLAALFLAYFTSQAQPPASAPQQQLPSVQLPAELDRVLRDYEKAWIARDPKALGALFAPDGFVLQSGRPPIRGRQAIERAYQGAGGPLHLRALEFKAEGNTAWIVGAFSGAADQPDSGKFVLALTRESDDGRWLIAADIDTPNQPPRRRE